MALDLAADVGRRMVIRDLQLDGLEAGGRGGSEPLEQRPFGEEIGEVGGETGHGALLYGICRRERDSHG